MHGLTYFVKVMVTYTVGDHVMWRVEGVEVKFQTDIGKESSIIVIIFNKLETAVFFQSPLQNEVIKMVRNKI